MLTVAWLWASSRHLSLHSCHTIYRLLGCTSYLCLEYPDQMKPPPEIFKANPEWVNNVLIDD